MGQARPNPFRSGYCHRSDGADSQTSADDRQPQRFPNAPVDVISFVIDRAARMDSENKSPDPSPEPPAPGYQPSTGRKLFMFILCLVALIAVWVFYWFASK